MKIIRRKYTDKIGAYMDRRCEESLEDSSQYKKCQKYIKLINLLSKISIQHGEIEKFKKKNLNNHLNENLW